MTVFGEMIKCLNHLDKCLMEYLRSGSQNETHNITSVLRDRVKSDFSSMSKKQFFDVCVMYVTTN